MVDNIPIPLIRLGDLWFRLATGEQFFDETGLRGLRQTWESLFPGRQNVSGFPGIQNLRDDDLRVALDSFAGGQGQRVSNPGDPESLRRFERSNGVDLAFPGEMRLAREILQLGLTGGAPTTHEGSTWAEDVAPTSVIGNDRSLDGVNARASITTASLAAANYQVDVHAYSEETPHVFGADLLRISGSIADEGDFVELLTEGTEVQTGPQDPANDVDVTVTFLLTAAGSGSNPKVKFNLKIYNATDDKTVKNDEVTLNPESSGNLHKVQTLSFTAKAGKTYRYRVKLLTKEHALALVRDVQFLEETPKEMLVELRRAGVTIASTTVDLKGITESTRIASFTISEATGSAWVVRCTRSTGSDVDQIIDKMVYAQVAMDSPRLIELGLDDLIWLVDYSASTTASLLYWNRGTNQWTAVANAGPSGGKAVALAHSDSYEFVALDNKIVYRGKRPATFEQYTAATTDSIVGIAVGGNRLLILTEAAATGTTLFDAELEGTPNVALTSRYAVGDKGVNADLDVSQRIAGTRAGAVFYINQGPKCWVYEWDGQAGAPLADLPTGFRGRAIAHGNGFTWIGGSFPAVDATGVTRHRPAVFAITADGTPTEVGVQLYNDADPGAKVIELQLYGRDLFVLTEESADPKTMRIWRVDLRSPIGAFLEQEIVTDSSQQTGAARGLAVTWKERIAIWSVGNPYHQGDEYQNAGELVSSRYWFGLTDLKLLRAFDVMGTFPDGTGLGLAVVADDGTEVVVGEATESGVLVVSGLTQPLAFRYLQLIARPFTQDTEQTPVIYSVESLALLQSHRKQFELLVLCADDDGATHPEGIQLAGAQSWRYLFELADGGGLVEFEDASSEPGSGDTYTVAVEQPDRFLLAPGLNLVRVRLVERAA